MKQVCRMDKTNKRPYCLCKPCSYRLDGTCSGPVVAVKDYYSLYNASVKYNKAHDYFGIRPDKETGAAIRQAAAAAGKSVQRYILDAVQSRMEYDAWKNARNFPGEVGPPNL